MERSTAKVACGFAFQLLLYALYILTGIAVVTLGALAPAEGGPSQVCLINIKVYACLGVLAAFRAVVKLCLSFHKYLKRQSTFPTVRELWVRVIIKLLVTVHGLILFGVFRREGQLLALQRTGYSLWCFYGVTLWPNLISVCLVPFNFKASLQTARRIQEEQAAEAGTRPLSSQHSHHQYAPSSKYSNFAQRSLSSGYHVESPEDFRRGGGGGQRGSEQSAAAEERESDLDPYAAAARFA